MTFPWEIVVPFGLLGLAIVLDSAWSAGLGTLALASALWLAPQAGAAKPNIEYQPQVGTDAYRIVGLRPIVARPEWREDLRNLIRCAGFGKPKRLEAKFFVADSLLDRNGIELWGLFAVPDTIIVRVDKLDDEDRVPLHEMLHYVIYVNLGPHRHRPLTDKEPDVDYLFERCAPRRAVVSWSGPPFGRGEERPRTGRLDAYSWPQTLQEELRDLWLEARGSVPVCLRGVIETGPHQFVRFQRLASGVDQHECARSEDGIGWGWLVNLDRKPTEEEVQLFKQEVANVFREAPRLVHVAAWWWYDSTKDTGTGWMGPNGYGLTRWWTG